MIVDVHTHICSPRVRTDRERFLSPEETAFSAIYQDPKARLAGVSELKVVMDEEGVDRSVTFGFPWASRETARAENDYVLDSQARFPDRITALACFDPLQPWAEEEAVRCLEQGARGLGELAVYDAGFDQDALERLSALGAICRDFDVPLLLHVNEPIGHRYPGKAPLTVGEIYQACLNLAGIRLILAHWGGGIFFYNLLKKEVPQALADVYFDTAASPFLYRPDIYRLAAQIMGPEKILLGTDYPLLHPHRYFRELEQSGLDPLTDAEIKGRAAARVFGWKED